VLLDSLLSASRSRAYRGKYCRGLGDDMSYDSAMRP
jgi:hypothetical protein